MSGTTFLIVENQASAYKRVLKVLVPDADITLCNLQQVGTETRADLLIADPASANEFFKNGGRVPWVQSTWAGIDPFLTTARKHQVLVTGIKGVFGPQASQYVFAHLLSDAQQLPHFSGLQSQRLWQHHEPQNLAGKTLLVIGAGDIGCHIGQTAKHFAMRLVGVTNSGSSLPGFDLMYSSKRLPEAIAPADYIVACLPGGDNTSELINKDVLNACKHGACLINIGRASSVVTDDLIVALKTGQLSRVVLDVLDTEPLEASSPLWSVPNLTITPHVAAISTVAAIAPLIADNVKRFQRNTDLKYIVDLEKGY